MATLLIFLHLFAAPASPLDQAESDLPAQVRKLVRQLDDPQVQVQNKAEAKLIELGPPALEWLPSADEGSDELRRRLTRVRQAIEKAQASQNARASLVTLKGEMPLAEALEKIEKQTGNPFGNVRDRLSDGLAEVVVETDFDETPFWLALDTLLDRADLTIYHYSGEEHFALRPRPESLLPRRKQGNYVGPFRVAATHVSAERQPPLDAPGVLKIGLEVAWEPRLHPLAVRQSLGEVRATDDEGNALEIEDLDVELEVVPQRGYTAAQMSLPFQTPPRTAMSVASLRGTLNVLTPGKAETFEFDKLDEAAKADFKTIEQKKGTASVSLERVTHSDDLWEVWMRVRFTDSARALDSHRLSWLHDNEAYLLGPDGKPIPHAGYEGTGSDENEVGFSYKFEAPAGKLDQYKFVYKTPASIQLIPIEYEIKNLDLP